MQDAFGRTIDYLRLSITDRCQFRCAYCMPPGGVTKLPHAEMLSLEELFEVVRLMVTRLGFRKVRVTGGEPLDRRGALEFMTNLGRLSGIEDLSLTTNGYVLAPEAQRLREAGYRRVNISLDTLRADRFQTITGVDGLARVLEGVAAARRAGFDPIKINCVALEETLDEAADLVGFGVEQGLQVRFIELMPLRAGNGAVPGLTFVPTARVRAAVETRWRLTPLDPDGQARAASHSAAELFTVEGTSAVCGFISSMTSPFCRNCNRIRLRGDGQLKPCLASAASISLMSFIRPLFRADDLERFLLDVVPSLKKARRGDYDIDAMSTFGG